MFELKKIKRWFLFTAVLFIGIGCNQKLNHSYLSETGSNLDVEAQCFDKALLIEDAYQEGRLRGLMYGVGICYNDSVALDDRKSFFAEAVIVKLTQSNQMFASYVYKNKADFSVKDESGQSYKIGRLSTIIGEVEIKLFDSVKTQVAWEQAAGGSQERVQVLILEIDQ